MNNNFADTNSASIPFFGTSLGSFAHLYRSGNVYPPGYTKASADPYSVFFSGVTDYEYGQYGQYIARPIQSPVNNNQYGTSPAVGGCAHFWNGGTGTNPLCGSWNYHTNANGTRSYATLSFPLADWTTTGVSIGGPIIGGLHVSSIGISTDDGATVQGTPGSTSDTYKIVACGSGGCAPFSTTITVTNANATLSSTNYNRLTWRPTKGGTAAPAFWKIYRTSTGQSGLSNGYLGTVWAACASYYAADSFNCLDAYGGTLDNYYFRDTGVNGDGSVPPSADTSADVTIDGGLTVGIGSRLAAITYYSTTSITPAAVSAQACADQTFSIAGLAVGDKVSAVIPPSALGNLSIVGYVSSTSTLLLHFCNPSTSSVTPPAGIYSFVDFR